MDGLGDEERLATTVDESAVMPKATARAVGSSEADAGVANAALESGMEKPVVPEEQAAFQKTPEGVVGHAVRPPSPQVAPPAAEEEDEVEEIESEEARPQAVRILHKRGDEVVVVEEEDTTREVRRLESTLSIVMKQIKVSIESSMFVFDVEDWSSS